VPLTISISSTTARSNTDDTKQLTISHLVSRLSQLLPQQKRFEATACVAVLCSAGCSEQQTRIAVVKTQQQGRQLH